MDWKLSCCCLVSLALCSCAQLGGIKKKEKPGDDPYGLGAYQQAGGRVSGSVDTGGVVAGVQSAVKVGAVGLTRDEDIIWANEDPNAPIGDGLEQLWKQPENKSWHTSYTEAMQQSRQTGKPMMIWFTDSRRSPLCRRLSEELFSKSEFEGWASQRLVRLRVDTSVAPSKRGNLTMSEYDDLKSRKIKYIEKLKKRYNVRGHPTVTMLSPRGAVVISYRGYKKGDPDYYWGRMKQSLTKAEEDYGSWREKLEKRGYRLWTSRDGRKTFAKLYRFKPGSITLIDPDGKRGTTSFARLSDADQAWVMSQKKKYDEGRGR